MQVKEWGRMEPISAGATAAAKGIGGLLGKKAVAVLKDATMRPRVAKAVVRAVQADGVVVERRVIAAWLARDDVQRRLSKGSEADIDACTAELAELTSSDPVEDAGKLVLQAVLDETLRRLSEGDARVELARRLERAARASGTAEQRVVLRATGDEDAFQAALSRLHVWRRKEASDLAERFPALRSLVITLAAQEDRAGLVTSWEESPPAQARDAPAEVWCWLGLVAADYGASEASVGFIERGIEAGAAQPYWSARAGLILGTKEGDSAARARSFFERSHPPHVIALAATLIDREEFAEAEIVLDRWIPENHNDRSLKAILSCIAATGLGDLNRAISIGQSASEELPDASGLMLRTAEALLSRGHFGISDHVLDDFARAFELAVRARDARRPWRGDSVACALVAIKAAALATDVERAWQLSQGAPDGEALPEEVSDPRLRREVAILAATTGRLQMAAELAHELADEYVTQTVRGWTAVANDDSESAVDAFRAAWAAAPDDVARLQTASAVAPYGTWMPDLSLISEGYSSALEELKAVHRVMSASGNRIALLRARSGSSERMTVLLAEQLSAKGEYLEAGEALERGGTTWNHPLLMRMAADRYSLAGEHSAALRAATSALSLGGPAWAGRLQTLIIQFESLEAEGLFDQSLAVAREMVAAAPGNLGARWALIHSLVRRGDIHGAWNALLHNGYPAEPRDAAEVRTWVGLAAECDNSPEFVPRVLELMSHWRSEPDLMAICLMQIYLGLSRHDREVADADLKELHAATDAFTKNHPDSSVFRRFSFDESDPVGSLTEVARQREEAPEVKEIARRVSAGELPLGLLADAYQRPYFEAALRRAAGLVYCHSPELSDAGAQAAQSALEAKVVLDNTVAATLSLLDDQVVDVLLGSFRTVESTDASFRDALNAQRSLGLRSTLTVGWDDERHQPVVSEISDDQAEWLADQAERSIALLSRTTRRAWPSLHRFSAFERSPEWLSAIDYALTVNQPFWCDDRVLRQLAAQEGVPTFGTVDLLNAMALVGALSGPETQLAKATLIKNFYVDLPFDLGVARFAAELDGWAPRGAAAVLGRPTSWMDPDVCLRFLDEALSHAAHDRPDEIRGWVRMATLGLVELAGPDIIGAGGNLQILLTRVMTQTWLGPSTLPFVLEGIRDVSAARGVADPLRHVLGELLRIVSTRHGASAAAEFVLMFVASLPQEDRSLAANAILTAEL